jgi:hypothetical protein
MKLARGFASLVCAVLVSTQETAHAGTSAPEGGAADPQGPFDEGRALMRAGRFAEALERFEKSLAIRTTGGALLNRGDCLEKLGRYASAVSAFDQAQALLDQLGDPARAAFARQRADELRPRCSTITPSARGLAGASASIDGVPVPIGTPFRVDGGDHVVKIWAPCHEPFETRVTIFLREAIKEVDAPLHPSTDASCGGRSADTVPSTSWTTRDTVAIVLGSAGVIALGVGGFFGVRAIGSKHDLEGLCTNYPNGCNASQRDEVERLASTADSQALVATIAFGVGLGALLGAGVAYLTSPRSSPAAIATRARDGVLPW